MGFANREFRVAQTGLISDTKRRRKRLLPTQNGVSNATREMDKPRTLTVEFSIFVIFTLFDKFYIVCGIYNGSVFSCHKVSYTW
jgi:hypothetical protein